MIKKIFFLASLFSLLIFPFLGFAENIEDVHIFEIRGCPDCARAKDFLENEIRTEYPDIQIISYQIDLPENQEKFRQMMSERNITDYSLMVPTIFIGENHFQNFYEDDKDLIRKAIEGELVERTDTVVSLPVFGEIIIEDWSLPILALVIGSLDGLNVCSIGALILILMIVLTFHSRKKIIFYGGLFIVTTVSIYGILVFAWTALFEAFARFIGPINIFIGIAALLGGVYFCNQFIRFYKYGPTCTSSTNKFVTSATQKLQKTFSNPKSQIIALASSIVFFATVITLVELPCSFGLPMVYGAILAESGLSWIGYVSYILLYLFFYMLIEIVIFAGAIITKEVWIAESKIITWVYLAGTIVLFFLSYYYLIGF